MFHDIILTDHRLITMLNIPSVVFYFTGVSTNGLRGSCPVALMYDPIQAFDGFGFFAVSYVPPPAGHLAPLWLLILPCVV